MSSMLTVSPRHSCRPGILEVAIADDLGKLLRYQIAILRYLPLCIERNHYPHPFLDLD